MEHCPLAKRVVISGPGCEEIERVVVHLVWADVIDHRRELEVGRAAHFLKGGMQVGRKLWGVEPLKCNPMNPSSLPTLNGVERGVMENWLDFACPVGVCFEPPNVAQSAQDK